MHVPSVMKKSRRLNDPRAALLSSLHISQQMARKSLTLLSYLALPLNRSGAAARSSAFRETASTFNCDPNLIRCTPRISWMLCLTSPRSSEILMTNSINTRPASTVNIRIMHNRRSILKVLLTHMTRATTPAVTPWCQILFNPTKLHLRTIPA